MNTIVKTWLVPIIIVLAGAVGIFFLWPRNIQPPKMEQTGIRPPVPAPAGDLSAADELRVKNRYGEFRLTRQGNAWRLVSPVDARANTKWLDTLFNKMQTFQFGLMVGSSASPARDKVAGAQAVEVHVLQGGRTLWHFFLGKSAEYTLFRQDGSDDVWQIKGAVRQVFVRDTDSWIQPEIVGASLQDVEELAFFGPDGAQFARFAFSGEKREEVKLLSGPDNWHPARVRRSLGRLLNLRIEHVDLKMPAPQTTPAGTAELVVRGRKIRVTFYPAQDTRTPLRVEEEDASGKPAAWPFFPLVQPKVQDILLLEPMDLADPLVLQVQPETIQAVRGKCGDFSWDFVRNDKGEFIVRSATKEFALARSQMEAFLAFLSSGNLAAVDVLAAQAAPGEFLPTPDSDFIEVELVSQGKGKKPETLRVAWGKPTPVDAAGYRYHHVAVSGRPDRVYKVMDKHIAVLCRTRESWMLQAIDPENTPVPGKPLPGLTQGGTP